MPKKQLAIFVVVDVILVAAVLIAVFHHVKVLYVLLGFAVLSVINGIFMIVPVVKRTGTQPEGLWRRLCHMPLSSFTSRAKTNRSIAFSSSLDRYFAVTLSDKLLEFLSPLDQQDTARFCAKICDTQGRGLALGVDPV